MNDELIMNNYLLLLKSTVEVYVHGTLEASNQDVRSLLKNDLNTTMSSQANTYDLMSRFGYYTTTNVDNNTIKQTINKLKQQ